MNRYAVRVMVLVEVRDTSKTTAKLSAEEYVHRLVTANHHKPANKQIVWVESTTAKIQETER